MNHEPECPIGKGYGVLYDHCICYSLRAAYQRGREDAATAVAMGEIPKENNAPLDPTWNAAIEWGALAARGDGEREVLVHADECDPAYGCTCGTRTLIIRRDGTSDTPQPADSLGGA